MISAGLAVKGATVTILGFTFKENVPDTRNTRVIDIVRSLEDYKVNVQLHDPIADTNITFKEYGVNLMDIKELKPGNAIILAVAHTEFCVQGWDLISKLLKDKRGVVFDVQRVLEREKIPAGMELLRM